MMDPIGERVRASLRSTTPRMTQKQLASAVQMTEDALSRALNGVRGFASIELARIADALGGDLHELITGKPDPNRVSFVARATYDHEGAAHTVPSEESDKAALENIRIAYVQAGLPPHRDPLPSTVEDMRAALGGGFIERFADRVEERLEVDVIVIQDVETAYSATIAGRRVIILPARPEWFRMNFSLAHELAHLAGVEGEAAANTFASKLLLPPDELRGIDWTHGNVERLADFLWERGVSAPALRVALERERLEHNLDAELNRTTRVILHEAWSWEAAQLQLISQRMSRASERRFPTVLREAHEKRALDGAISHGYLAWMLGVSPDTFEDDGVVEAGESLDDLASALGLELA